jgi:amino acid adenylation domain-containing protein
MTEVLRDWFRKGLTTGPCRTALKIGEREWTYEEVDALALAWAGALAQARECHRGVSLSSRVGILAERSIESYAGVIAGLYAGVAVVPLSPQLPPSRIARMIDEADARFLIADRAGVRVLKELAKSSPSLRVMLPLGEGRSHNAEVDLIPLDPAASLRGPLSVGPKDGAYVLFTSGSTGRPKGIEISNENISHFLSSSTDRYRFNQEDVFSQSFSQSFDLAMFDLFMAWSCGGMLVSTPPQALARLERFVNEVGLTVWFSVPSAIAAAMQFGQLQENSLPTLRCSLFCGEALWQKQVSAWHRAAPNSIIENLYGPTELTVACTVHRWDEAESASAGHEEMVPIGAPYPEMEAIVVGEEKQPATEGELWMRGPQMFGGYLGHPRHENTFRLHDGKRWYPTGDRVRVDENGALHFLGRRDSQIKLQGYRIELMEIERCLCGIEGVTDGVVILAENRSDERQLAAFYVGSNITRQHIVGKMSEELPSYMVPRHIWNLESIPLTGSGKKDRLRLSELVTSRLQGSTVRTNLPNA